MDILDVPGRLHQPSRPCNETEQIVYPSWSKYDFDDEEEGLFHVTVGLASDPS